MAIYYNFLHAIELALKAYLRQVEAMPLKKRRSRAFGHNIARLLKVAIEEGICSHCSLQQDQIAALHMISGLYSNKRLEYFYLGGGTLPHIHLLVGAADVIIKGINSMNLRLAEDPNGT